MSKSEKVSAAKSGKQQRTMALNTAVVESKTKRMQGHRNCVNFFLYPNTCRIPLKGLGHPPECRKQADITEYWFGNWTHSKYKP